VVEAIRRYGRALCISFNGGKDASVVLHLVSVACSLYSSSSPSSSIKGRIDTTDLSTIYYQEKHRFLFSFVSSLSRNEEEKEKKEKEKKREHLKHC